MALLYVFFVVLFLVAIIYIVKKPFSYNCVRKLKLFILGMFWMRFYNLCYQNNYKSLFAKYFFQGFFCIFLYSTSFCFSSSFIFKFFSSSVKCWFGWKFLDRNFFFGLSQVIVKREWVEIFVLSGYLNILEISISWWEHEGMIEISVLR